MKARTTKKRIARTWKDYAKNIRRAEAWMLLERYRFDYGTAFDMAVDCAYVLGFSNASNDWKIPEWVQNLASKIME